jgi:hypothetical protein
MDLTVTQRLKIVADTQGVDAATREMEKLAASSEGVGRSALSVERALERQRKSLDSSYNSFKLFQKAQEDLVRAQQQGLVGLDEYNKLSALNKQRYEQSTQAAGQFNKALNTGTGEARLARHELINLSRQVQDVGVSLASGQAPLTVLVQQGSQIADVFASSTGTLRGFFTQATAGASVFLRSAAGIAVTVGTFGTAIGLAAASYSSGQREIEKALSGIGRASGVTRDQINQIAEASASGFGLSVSEARTAAMAFAATGKIYGQNVEAATKMVDAYARAGGDAAEVTKMLAGAMSDPVAGAMEINKQFGFLDATTLNLIRSLQSQGRQQDAIKVMLDAAAPSIQKAAEQTGFWAKAWNLATNSASEYFEMLGKIALRAAEGVTGARMGGYSQSEDYERARRRQASNPFQGALAGPMNKALEDDVRKLEKAMIEAGLATLKTREAIKSLAADAASRAFLPLQAEIEKVTQNLNALINMRLDKGGEVTGAEKVGNLRLVQIQEQNAALVRQAEVTAQIALMYPGMTTEGANQLFMMQQQLTVAQAKVGVEQLNAQQQATVNTLWAQGVPLQEAMARAALQRQITEAQATTQAQANIVTLQGQLSVAQTRSGAEAMVAQEAARVTQLLQQQVPIALALQTAALERKISEENVAKAIDQQLKNLDQEYALMKAISPEEQARVKAAQAYEKAMAESNDTLRASKIASATLRNETEKIAKSQQEASDAAAQRANTANVAAIQQENAAINALIASAQRLAYEWENVAGVLVSIDWEKMEVVLSKMGNVQTWMDANGQRTQFNPDGYSIVNTQSSNAIFSATSQFGAGGYTLSNQGGGLWGGASVATPNAQGVEHVANQLLQQGQSLQSVMQAVLKYGDAGMQVSGRLTQLLPDAEKISGIQSQIGLLSSQPRTLENQTLLKQLTDQLKNLTQSTDNLNATMQQALSPYYSQDPRTTKLGFRAGVVANPDWMAGGTNANPTLSLTGFASGGSFIVPGGYSANDNMIARFPVASGEQVVVNRTPGDQAKTVNIDNRVIIQGNVDQSSITKLKRTQFQQAQRMRATMVA